MNELTLVRITTVNVPVLGLHVVREWSDGNEIVQFSFSRLRGAIPDLRRVD